MEDLGKAHSVLLCVLWLPYPSVASTHPAPPSSVAFDSAFGYLRAFSQVLDAPDAAR